MRLTNDTLEQAIIGHVSVSLNAVMSNGMTDPEPICFQVVKEDTIDLRAVKFKLFPYSTEDSAKEEYLDQLRYALESQSYCTLCGSGKGRFVADTIEVTALVHQLTAKFDCEDCGARFPFVFAGKVLHYSR